MTKPFGDEIVDLLKGKLSEWNKDKYSEKIYLWPEKKQADQMERLRQLSSNDYGDLVNEVNNKGSNQFAKAISLRREIQKIKEFKFELSKWIIEDWGGIRSQDDESLKACLKNHKRPFGLGDFRSI